MISVLALLLCLGAGVVGGVFLAFSSFVLRALAELPDREGIAAMQRINVVVLNPLFLGVFAGTAVLAVGTAVAALLPWDPVASPWLVVSAVLYLAGTFLVTGVGNVPLNQLLAPLDPAGEEARRLWPRYVRRWGALNHIRTASAVASAACAAVALVVG